MNQSRKIMVFMVITTAVCLRAPITSVGSIVYCIAEELHLSSAESGFITTMPLIVMALLSSSVSKVSNRFGEIKTLLTGLLLITIGLCIRSTGGFGSILLGTTVIGAGITFGNVMIPAIIKLFFPDRIGTMTGVFTTTMSVCSGVGAGISVPLAVGLGLGWRLTLAIWLISSVTAAGVILIQLAKNRKNLERNQNRAEDLRISEAVCHKEASYAVMAEPKKSIPIYKVPLAWCAALLFGGQSCVFYMLVAWLPTILHDRGFSAVAAGGIATVFQVAAIPANFGVPILAGMAKDQKRLSAVIAILAVLGLLGIMFSKSIAFIAISTALVALGVGGTFSLTLVIFSMRASTPLRAAQLSGFAQGGGYVMAAIAPALAGILYDWASNWTLPLSVMIFTMLISLAAGQKAGEDVKI